MQFMRIEDLLAYGQRSKKYWKVSVLLCSLAMRGQVKGGCVDQATVHYQSNLSSGICTQMLISIIVFLFKTYHVFFFHSFVCRLNYQKVTLLLAHIRAIKISKNLKIAISSFLNVFKTDHVCFWMCDFVQIFVKKVIFKFCAKTAISQLFLFCWRYLFY